MIVLVQNKEDDDLKVIVFCGEEKASEILKILQCGNTASIANYMDTMCNSMLEFVKVDEGEIHENEHDHEQHNRKYYEVGDKVKAFIGNAGRAYFETVKCIKVDSLIDVLHNHGKHDFDIEGGLIFDLTP